MTADVPHTLSGAADQLARGELSSVDLVTTLLDRMERANPPLGAMVTVTGQSALAAARRADHERLEGRPHGPLHGIPLVIKDIIATSDAPTTANSRALPASWVPAGDATVVARLRDQGAVLLGKATAGEFACGEPDAGTGFAVPRNPWNLSRSPLGSSSGTAVAVAAGLALGGLGTDTGGSIRGPAAATGITGLCVTFGRVPRTGVVPLAWSMDTVGPMARTARDCAALLQAMAGHDPGDESSARMPVPDYEMALSRPPGGFRVGIPDVWLAEADLDPSVSTALASAAKVLERAGTTLCDVAVPYAAEAAGAGFITSTAESFALHSANLSARWSDYGRYARLILSRGGYVTAREYMRAQQFRTLFRSRLRELFRECDAILLPVLGGPVGSADKPELVSRFSSASFTRQWNTAGYPSISFPAGVDPTGMPVGLQLVAAPFDEGTLLALAHAFQQYTHWHTLTPDAANWLANAS